MQYYYWYQIDMLMFNVQFKFIEKVCNVINLRRLATGRFQQPTVTRRLVNWPHVAWTAVLRRSQHSDHPLDASVGSRISAFGMGSLRISRKWNLLRKVSLYKHNVTSLYYNYSIRSLLQPSTTTAPHHHHYIPPLPIHSTTHHHTLPHPTTPYHTPPHPTTHYHTPPYPITPHNIPPYHTTPHLTPPHPTTPYHNSPHPTIHHHTSPHITTTTTS